MTKHKLHILIVVLAMTASLLLLQGCNTDSSMTSEEEVELLTQVFGPDKIELLFEVADAIIVGTVIGIDVQVEATDSGPQTPISYVDVRVDKTLKTPPPEIGDNIIIRAIGGFIGDAGAFVSSEPTFLQIGETFLAPLELTPEGYRVILGSEGKIAVPKN